MKKIIAISVMLALVAGAVFAETSVSGGVETRFSLAKQTGADGDDPVMGGSIGAAHIQLSGTNDDGTLSGTFRLRNVDIVRKGDAEGNDGAWFHKAFVWWKPVPQARIFLGIEQDGLFDTTSIVGWGFHAGDNDYIFNHHWDFWREIFPGNWDGFGLALSFYPMPGLDINLVLPTGGVNWPQATLGQVGKNQLISGDAGTPDNPGDDGMLPARMVFQVGYGLDFGRISFTYQGSAYVAEKGMAWWDNGKVNDLGIQTYSNPFGIEKNNGRVGLSFLYTALEGIDILAGGSIVLNENDAIISGGLGAAYSGDGFGVKVRAGLQMQDKMMLINGNIMPTVAVGESGQVLVDIGFTQVSFDGESEMGWSLIPAYRHSISGGAFKIGLQIYNNIIMGGNIGLSGADFVRWNIPMLLSFNF